MTLLGGGRDRQVLVRESLSDQKSHVGPVMSVMVHYYPTHNTQSSTHSSERPLILFPILSQLLVSVVCVCVCVHS